MNMVQSGIKGRQETVVSADMLAVNVGSGKVAVFATPMMVALMEKTASESIEPYLDEGQGSVGVHLDVSHCAATPEGMRVWAETEVTGIDRRRVTFSVKAYDERGLIGEGTHDRFIIDMEKFQAKAEGR